MLPRSGLVALSVLALAAALWSTESHAQRRYDPGASDTEIKVGNIMPYSGPASSFAVIGQTEAAYFQKDQ
jgi:branched-chain amino acid transport system substrate-binding protein